MKRFVLFTTIVITIAFAVGCGHSVSQSPPGDQHAGHASGSDNTSPYAGQEQRNIKALSNSEINGFLNGEGMGFAKAAELNGYPGPKHVLELKDALGLPQEQVAKVSAVFDRMKADAVRIGHEIVENETSLEASFRQGSVSAESLKGQTAEIERLKGELRYAHLAAHLETKAVMTPEQIAKYNELRGYKH